MEPILDRNILAEGSEECGRIARKLRRVSEAFLDSFRVLRTEALILDDSCLDNRKKTTSALALRLLSSTIITYRNYNINIHNGSTMTGGSR